jgi:hypothetical protein
VRRRPKQTPRHESWRRYAAKRYWSRKALAIALLGGKCVRCGDDGGVGLDLQFDHLPGTTKRQCVTWLLHYKWETVLEELKKCQLVCPPCHEELTDARNHDDDVRF